jgi:nitrite reductase/ring-hydroxylating ferredoxin subunit
LTQAALIWRKDNDREDGLSARAGTTKTESDDLMADGPVPVCATADLPPGSVKSFDVGDETVAIYNVDGEFYATHAYCTHAIANLGDGVLDGDIIECTLHFGAFNVKTGKAIQAPCFTDLKTYKTEVKDGQVYVDLNTPAPTAG